MATTTAKLTPEQFQQQFLRLLKEAASRIWQELDLEYSSGR